MLVWAGNLPRKPAEGFCKWHLIKEFADMANIGL